MFQSSSMRRRKGRARLFALGAACLTSAGVSPALAQPADQGPVIEGTAARSAPIRFDIAPGPLEAVLAAFGNATQNRVVFADPGLRTVPSPGVSGNLTLTEALTQVLRGLSVRATFDGTSVTLAVR